MPAAYHAWQRLQREVVLGGTCTHCGTCVGLSKGSLRMEETSAGPLPVPARDDVHLPPEAYQACPGKGIDYPDAYRALHGALPANWLLGCYRQVYVGHAASPTIRRRAASGGVITQTLLYLLDRGQIDGAVVLQQGQPEPWLARPIIASNREEIIAASQSVYVPVAVNTILPQMEAFDGRLAYVGLPDQVAALRRLQREGHQGACKVDFVLGPYVGTGIYLGAIESFLRSNGIRDIREIASLKYREGEWPGHLEIRTRSGRTLRAEKFYYNYLIPFYVTQATLQAVDFTNELTDISVGDAWHPSYESRGQGYSVVVVRTTQAEAVLDEMQREGILVLEPTTVTEALSMHGHMLDFKKRGAFIRNEWRRLLGKEAPSYGYRPEQIPLSRKVVEFFIVLLFATCRTRPARRLVEWVALGVLGPIFDFLRRSWKSASKPVKRKGLHQVTFVPVDTDNGSYEGDSSQESLTANQHAK